MCATMDKTNDFAAFMRRAYLNWQQEHGEILEKQEFAKYLGVSKQLLGHYMSGRQRPSADRIDHLAALLGPEVYDTLGVPRRDPVLLAIVAGWGKLSEETRDRIAEVAGHEIPELKQHGQQTKTAPRRVGRSKRVAKS